MGLLELDKIDKFFYCITYWVLGVWNNYYIVTLWFVSYFRWYLGVKTQRISNSWLIIVPIAQTENIKLYILSESLKMFYGEENEK